jgi:3-deoxy-D-manno-octulosonic-acid transferase
METEVWPNLVAACRARGIPLALANARLNDHSLARALRLAPLSRPAYAGLTAVWAQTAADAEHLAQLGARVQGVFGNLKFDARPDPVQCEQGRAWRATFRRPVVLFASSREGEERDFFALARRAVAADLVQKPSGLRVPRVQWMIVPRHPQRFGEVEAMALEAGLSVSRRSQWRHGPVPADVWLGDSMGEMALYYSLADVALLGGSFAPLGGQNLIEAAACACPVVMGPHTFNFAEAAELAQAAGAAQQAPDMAGAFEAALKLLTDAGLHGLAREAASRFAQSHRGAAARTASAVLALAVPA